MIRQMIKLVKSVIRNRKYVCCARRAASRQFVHVYDIKPYGTRAAHSGPPSLGPDSAIPRLGMPVFTPSLGPGLYLGPESGPSSGVHCVVGLTDAHPPLTSEGVTVTIAKLQ